MARGTGNVSVGRRGQNKGNRRREIVSYVPVEMVDCRPAEGVEEVRERVECPLNVNVFGFVRSTMTQTEVNGLYLKYRIDPNMYKLSIIPVPTLMTTSYMLISISHLAAGVRFLLDPSFVDFLYFAKIQSDQLHPNATKTVFSLIVLCRRLGIEMTPDAFRLVC